MEKKLFIIGFGTSILKDVALRLQGAGARIMYWQGYRDYFREIMGDKKNFPNTIFHNSLDALRNIPPTEIDASAFEVPGRSIIEKMHPYGAYAMFLIERADFADFSLSQKRHIYYEYIRFWKGMIKKFGPDVIIFSDVPHDGNMYVLYALAMILKIKVLILEQIGVESRTLLINNHETSSLEVRDHYRTHQNHSYKIEDLSPDLRAYYQKHTDATQDATSEYQKRALARPAPFRTPAIRTVLKHIVRLSFFSALFSYLRMLFMKNEEQTLSVPMRGFRYKLIFNRWAALNRRLEKKYVRLQSVPDFSEKFVYIPLNIQPERTTCPQAGVYDDQLLMIETITASLPQGWKLYVKENPNQLRPANVLCRMYRYPEYYERIAKLPNVRLVSTETSTYDLIRNARAVAVATGTAGWEAILRGKPAIVFGSVWYMYCDGVFRVSDAESCAKALGAIEGGYTPDKQKVLNYLVALDKNSIRARHFRTLRYDKKEYTKDDYISHEDNIINISTALSRDLGL